METKGELQAAPGPDARRRQLVTGLMAAGSAAALGGFPGTASAQESKPAAELPGAIPNAEVMAGKDPVLKMHSERPLTASAPAEFQNFAVTPTRRMFVRNNLVTPKVDEARHVLSVKGLVDRPLELSMAELKGKYAVWSQQAMLECAGSGRTGFQPTPRGTPWPSTGGMGCPKWTGVSLAEVLKAAGLQPGAAYVAFRGVDFGPLPTIPPVVRSIPLAKALERHTMLAFAMNDEPLLPVHGFPLRSLVPGWAGSASTKWLTAIEVLNAPYKGPYMDESYRIPRNAVAPGEKMPADAAVTEGWPVKSMITSPVPDAKFKAGQPVVVEGAAWVGEGSIRRIELSFDEGVTWVRADVNWSGDAFAWRRFSYSHQPRRPGYQTVLARASDDNGNTQPIVAAWNPLGYFWNGVHRVGFVVEA
jgi:DMSO/TMAO reductase YedYZ molybdopterin-dependent catalytic subunit